MLLELSIENYALVRRLRIEFAPGLSAITGESGAGKSLLLGALGQVLGDRADTARISPDKTSSHISARFDLSCAPWASDFLAEHDLQSPDAPDECLLHRRIDANGRSRAYINDVSVTLATLRALASHLVDIHAQEQHHALRTQPFQRQVFDAYAARQDELAEVQTCWATWQAAQARANELRERIEARKERADLLRYQVAELEQLDLKDGEYEEVVAQHTRLSGVDELRRLAGQAIDLLEREEVGIGSRLSILNALLERMQDEQASLASAREAGLLAATELAQTSSDLMRYLDGLQADPEALRGLDERLSSIIELARKHRVAPDALCAHGQDLKAQLHAMADEDGTFSRLEEDIKQAQSSFMQAANALSERRQAAKAPFEGELQGYLGRLGLGEARIEVCLTPQLHEWGLEKVSFDYAASVTLAATPVDKVASGGERSRLALAVELLVARRARLPTLILDEADVGIGGHLSDEVGKLLTGLSSNAQILLITHAPQIAARADAHFRVVKIGDEGVSIDRLDYQQRLEEITRMLGGAHLEESTRSYARKLLESAREGNSEQPPSSD